MDFKYIEYNTLVQGIEENIQSLLKSHDLKTVEELKKDHKDRYIQVQLLQTVIALLNLMPPDTDKNDSKSRILTGLAYCVWEMIKLDYKEAALSWLVKPQRSDLYTNLGKTLNLSKTCMPSSEQISGMYMPLENFLRRHTFKDGNPKNGYAEVQPFAGNKFDDFSVEELIAKLSLKIAEIKAECVLKPKLEKEKARIDSKSAGSLGLFGVNDSVEDAIAANKTPTTSATASKK